MREEAEAHLREACRLTGSAWAALVESTEGRPTIRAAHKLTASRRRSLEACLAGDTGSAWFQRLVRRSAVGPLAISAKARLGVLRIRGYAAGKDSAILVGALKQAAGTQRFWELVARLMENAASAGAAAIPAGLESAEAYGSHQALDNILANFVASGKGQGAWLGIRRGDKLVLAASTSPEFEVGAALDLQSNPALERMWMSQTGVLAKRSRGTWDEAPLGSDRDSDFWAGLPLIVDDRFIGAIAIWGRKTLSSQRLGELGKLARDVSRSVDLIISLGEVSSQLHRLATLNEFALTISSVEGFSEMAQRVLAHMGAIFPAHKITLHVPSPDGLEIQEFSAQDGNFDERTAPISDHPMARWFSRTAEAGANRTREDNETARHFSLPLRYREAVVGVLALEGSGVPQLTRYEQSMLAVVASYMAGVVERSRLREEAEERTRRLEETVERLREAELAASTRLEAQQAAEGRLVQAAKLAAVGEMAAGVAHELNNPLTTVTGFAELILDETPADAPYREDLEMVLHEARRARSVVRRLLDFARQGEHVRARADVNEIVQDVLALMTHFIHTSGVQLEVELASELPWLTVDGNQIKQVLLNLLHNALQAMPGGGRLQVRTQLLRRNDHDWVVTDVADDGLGIEPSEMERIFEPFYTTRGESGGTGLGLSVTYGIVADHGGTIEVRSQRGSGSTFSVWLPV